MRHKSARVVCVCLACLLLQHANRIAHGQTTKDQPPTTDQPTQNLSPIASLELTPEQVSHLSSAVADHAYIDAEKLLLAELNHDSTSPRAARLLAYIGSIYFLNKDYANAAIAWKKSDAIRKLEPQLQFSLAMAYIGIGHPAWARSVLVSLSTTNPAAAIYPYWLGRLAYDAHLYSEAETYFRQAITLDANMARAYDNLGLCLYYQNNNAEAIKSFTKAIALDRNSEHPSPWPYVNLAITQEFLGNAKEAELNLREAIRLAPQLPNAHYQLGIVLDDEEKPEDATNELQEAVRLDKEYAEPHIALARIYKQTGHKEEAKLEAAIYARLHSQAKPQNTPPVLR
jgi:tetratricopeptide (TPR) repeat protein